MLSGLSVFWIPVSFIALNWLSSEQDRGWLELMNWLCLILLAIQVVLVVSAVYAWLHPRQEYVLVDRRRRMTRRIASEFLAGGFVAFWLASLLPNRPATWVGWLGLACFAIGGMLILLDYRTARKSPPEHT